MKKLTLLIFIVIAFISCKRKQTLRELESGQVLVKYPTTCYNGVQDPEETGVDCGGPCGSCNVVTPSCSYTNNIVLIGANNYLSSGTTCTLNGSYFRFSGNYTNGTYYVDLGTPSPDMSKSYAINYSVPNSNECNVTFSDGSYGNLILSAGTVFITQSGGKYHATICGGSAYSFVTSQSYTITGDVSCP